MQRTLIVRCPHCGSFAKRHWMSDHLTGKPHRESKPQVVRTECPHCDYLLAVCQDGSTIYSVYSPITTLLSQKQTDSSRQHQ